MRIMINYGKYGLPLNLPDEWDVTVIRKKPMPQLAEPQADLRNALLNPVGSMPLADLVRGRKDVCIVICDITRPVPNGVILPVLINSLLSAGMNINAITLLVATGLHRTNEGKELLEVVGDKWVLEQVKSVNHFARNDDDHVYLGKTRRNTPVKLDHRFIEADLRIVIGLVEPHFMAGYSGGRKVIAPGIAHQETIKSIHAARFLEQEGVANCKLEGNPLHEELLEIARMAGECLAINVVVDEMRRISFVNFGDFEQSHLAAVSYMRPFAEIHMNKKFNTVITSGAGYPLDKNYYQTVKGMVAAMDILEKGGNLFIASECSEGIGSFEYKESQRKFITAGADMFMKEIMSKEHADIDEWETEMQLKPMQIGTVHIYSEGLSDTDKALTGAHIIESLEEAILESVEQSGNKGVAVIPEGPYVIPLFRQ